MPTSNIGLAVPGTIYFGEEFAGAVAVPVSGSDTGSGGDASSLRAFFARFDTGSGAVTGLVTGLAVFGTIRFGEEFAGALVIEADTSNLRALLAGTETGAGVDFGSVLTSPSFSLTDLGSGIDSVGNRTLAAQDLGAGFDFGSTVQSPFTRHDFGTARDAVANRVLASYDTAHGTDTHVLQVPANFFRQDFGHSVELVSMRKLATTDSGVGLESYGHRSFGAQDIAIGTTLITKRAVLRFDQGVETDSSQFIGDRYIQATESHGGLDTAFLHAYLSAVDSEQSILEVGTIVPPHRRHRPHPPVPPNVDETYYFAINPDPNLIISGGRPLAQEVYVPDNS